jgi:hypothetical protein
MVGSGELLNFYFGLNGYIAVETDADSAASYMYYLYVNRFGHWYLTRIENISATQTEIKFAKGSSGYAAAWAARDTTVTYDFPDEVFKDL